MDGKTIRNVRILTDAAMTLALLLLMTYGLIGEAAHEWIGMAMLVLFVLHHILNRRWLLAVRKGRYNSVRIVQTVLVTLIFLCMAGSMASGILLSRYVFAFLPVHGGELAEKLHLFCAFWGFVLMSVHLGFHWNMVMAAVRRTGKSPGLCTFGMRLLACLWAVYGAASFWDRGVGDYLLLRSHFLFLDFSEPVIFYLLDYLSIMVMFLLLGYLFSMFLRRGRQRNSRI